MDANLLAEFLADAQAIVGEIGQTVTINSVSYQATVGEAQLTQSLEAGGLMDKIQTLIKIPATTTNLAASAYMQIGKSVTYNSRTFRIVAYTYRPSSVWIQILVQDADQR